LDRAQNQLQAQTIAYMTGANPPPEPRAAPQCGNTVIEKIFPKRSPGSTNVALNQNVLPFF
jgi:hypothetical protein